MLLFFPLLLLIFPSPTSAECTGSNRTTYLRSEGLRLMEFASHSLKSVSLNICADSCSTEANGHVCSSFEYDSRAQECAIHPEDGQPLGPSVLARAEPHISFFQQICLDERYLCSSPYAFERFPQSMLVGHSMNVKLVDGLSECLSICLSSQASIYTPCSSVMYFYETGECVMNRATRTEFPNLFKENVEEILVDYFENTCQDVSCNSEKIHWIRTEDYSISPKKDVIVESMSNEECRALCVANTIGQERFPCRAFVFSSSKKECHLSAESGYIGQTAKHQEGIQLNPISSGEYFQKYCLDSPLRCLDASFEQVANRKMTTTPLKTIQTPSVHHCLSLCLNESSVCSSVYFEYDKDLCHISETSQFSHPERFTPADRVDYFDKICDPVPGTERATAQAAPHLFARDEEELRFLSTEEPLPSLTTEPPRLFENENEIVGQTSVETESTVIDDDEDFAANEVESKNTVQAHLTSECRMSGVTVSVSFSRNTSGSIYIKDHFGSCKAVFHEASFGELHIPFPRADEASPRCPGLEIAPAHWSFMVVVQRNELSSPSLLTSTDRVFNVTCDYTELLERTAGLGRSAASAGVPDRDQGGDELNSNKIRMEILREGRPVTVVPLGDVVELRWTILQPETGQGYFVSECVAERVGGSPPEPEPLKLIYRGCPEERVLNRLLDAPIEEMPGAFSTRMKVFRFDGSRRVRIKCTIDVCVDRCPSVTCDNLQSTNRESFGRKKRQLDQLAGLLKKLKPSFAKESKTHRTVSGTLTVVERSEFSKGKKPRPEFSTTYDDRFCLLRWQIALAGLVAGLPALSLVLVLSYCYCKRHFLSNADDLSCASSLSGRTCSSVEFSDTSSLRPPLPIRNRSSLSAIYHQPHISR